MLGAVAAVAPRIIMADTPRHDLLAGYTSEALVPPDGVNWVRLSKAGRIIGVNSTLSINGLSFPVEWRTRPDERSGSPLEPCVTVIAHQITIKTAAGEAMRIYVQGVVKSEPARIAATAPQPDRHPLAYVVEQGLPLDVCMSDGIVMHFRPVTPVGLRFIPPNEWIVNAQQ